MKVPFKEITYNSDLLKKTWVLKETITPANHNELSRVVMDLVSNNGFIPSLTNLRHNSTSYVIGDCKHSQSLPSWAYLECVAAGTTAPTEPTWGTVIAGQEIVDGTVTWRIRDIKSASGVPIGTIMPHLVTTPPPGWLTLDTGALVSRTTYAELWTWVQENAPLISEADWQTQAASQSSVGYYSTGDGSTTFRLPRILDYVRGGLQSDVGEWQGDAIRNITGSGGTYAQYATNGTTGAVTTAVTSDRTANNGSGAGYGTISFDVSNVVPTADENRPKTIKFLYCVKAFDATTNQGLIDITELANEMANKVNITDYVNDFAHSLTTNGYQKLKGGLIIQWGQATTIGTTATVSVEFPVAFPIAALSVTTTGQNDNDATCLNGPPTATGFTASNIDAASTSTNRNTTFCWMAIGH